MKLVRSRARRAARSLSRRRGPIRRAVRPRPRPGRQSSAARKARACAVALSPVESADAAGLRYVTDEMPGIRRLRHGRGFRYLQPNGRPVRDPEELHRIQALAIPPAWTEVWICPLAHGHLQATGRDARGRKQARYHPRWRAVRDATKYHRMVAFGQALPRIRARSERDLARNGLPREKVLAAVVRLLETTLIRVGNEEYARHNHSFGLTTMHDRHVAIAGSTVRFEFRGKSGIRHSVDLHDRRLARIVRQCQEVPGHELFQYLDEQGTRHTIDSTDVNDYLRRISGEDFTAKDFRTWAGTVLAAQALQEFEHFDSQAQAKRNIVCAIEAVARRLGNTQTVCRKCYVHPAVLEAYLDGSLLHTLSQRVETELRQELHHLRPEEAAVLALLEERLRRETRANGPNGSRGSSRRRGYYPAKEAAHVGRLSRAIQTAQESRPTGATLRPA